MRRRHRRAIPDGIVIRRYSGEDGHPRCTDTDLRTKTREPSRKEPVAAYHTAVPDEHLGTRVTLWGEFTLFADRCYCQDVGGRRRILHGSSGAPRRHDTGHPKALHFLNLFFDQLGTLRAAQTEVDDVDLLLNTQIEGIDEIADPPFGEDL